MGLDMGIRVGKRLVKIGLGMAVLLLVLLVLLRDYIETFMLSVMQISNPDVWIDRAEITLLGVVFIAVVGSINKKLPVFLKSIKTSFTFDWNQVLDQTTKSAEGIGALQLQVSDMDARVSSSLIALRSDVGELGGEFRKIEETDEVQHVDRMKLVTIRMSKTPFLKKLSPALAEYAVLKANSFIDFVSSVHGIKFYNSKEGLRVNNPEMDFDRIWEEMLCEVSRVRQVACNFLSEDYIAEFFAVHDKNIHDYAMDLKGIIKDKTNYKHRRFQEISELFLANFLQDLYSTYIDYIRRGGDNVGN